MTRSYYDIANDAKKIEECYRDKTSFKELSEATGISRDSINNTLSKNNYSGKLLKGKEKRKEWNHSSCGYFCKCEPGYNQKV